MYFFDALYVLLLPVIMSNSVFGEVYEGRLEDNHVTPPPVSSDSKMSSNPLF